MPVQTPQCQAAISFASNPGNESRYSLSTRELRTKLLKVSIFKTNVQIKQGDSKPWVEEFIDFYCWELVEPSHSRGPSIAW